MCTMKISQDQILAEDKETKEKWRSYIEQLLNVVNGRVERTVQR